MMYKTTDSQDLELKEEDKWVDHSNYPTIANVNLLPISISGMPLVEAFLTISFLYQYQC